MRLSFNEWGGIAPRIDPLVLPKNLAANAVNANPFEYLLSPFKGLAYSHDLSLLHPKTVYLYESTPSQKWFEFDKHHDIVKLPIANDGYNQVAMTNGSTPQITRADIALTSLPYPTKTYDLGLPQPKKPLAEAVQSSPPDDLTDVDYYQTSYIITFVDAWGRESVASFPSNTVTRFETASAIQHVNILLPRIAPDNFPTVGDCFYRVYRSATSGNEYSYLFCAQVPVVLNTSKYFIDNVRTDELLEPLETASWFAPPNDNAQLWPQGGLTNLTVAANSFLCGNTGNTICYSEIGVFHAWPPEYQRTLPYKVVALAAIGTDIIALTEGYPYLLSGSHPSAISMMQITDAQSCISKDSVVATKNAVMYASPDGLCVIQNGQVEVISRNILTAAQWKAMRPETLQAYWSEGLYIARTATHTFFVSPGGDNRLMGNIDIAFECGYNDLKTDELYLCQDSKMYRFGKGAPLPMIYKTGIARTPSFTNFAWCAVRANAYPVEITLTPYNHNEPRTAYIYTKRNILSSEPFPLPADYQANGWQVEVRGNTGVISVDICHSRSEFN